MEPTPKLREESLRKQGVVAGVNYLPGGSMRIILVVLLALLLQGCWFVYIPAGLFSTANACAGEYAQVGQQLRHTDGREGTIKKVHGRSDRCQDGRMPMLVTVDFVEK